MLGSRFPRFVATIALTTLTGALLAVPASAAPVAPAARVASASSKATAPATKITKTGAVKPALVPSVAGPGDSSLSDLSVTGYLTDPAPAFDPAIHDYESVANDTGAVTFAPTVATVGANAVVASGGTTRPASGGSVTVPLTRGRNDVIVTVSSADTRTTTTYRVTVWRLAAPAVRVVSLADAHSTVFGGTRLTVTLADGSLPANCYRNATIGGSYATIASSTFDPATGLTKDVVSIPSVQDQVAGRADLVLTNTCYLPGNNTQVEAVTTAPGAVTYTAGLHVSEVDVPATVTTGTAIVVHGADLSGDTQAAYWLQDAQGNQLGLGAAGWTGAGSATVFPGYAWGNAQSRTSGPRTLHVGYCAGELDDLRPFAGGGGQFTGCTTVYSKVVNWVAPTPTELSFSPTSGAVTGGTTIRLRGRFLVSGTENLSISVGGRNVPNWTTVDAAYTHWSSFTASLQGQDIVEFPAPAATTSGPVRITVTSDIGGTVAPGSFTYSARPTITSVAPAAVANTGGSVITVAGTGFGTSGRPTVIVNASKSPFVTRISATRLTAVVPAAVGTTGPVSVSVSSAQGGGVSTAASLNLVGATTGPTITRITPAAGQAGDPVTVTGTGFGPRGTAGISVDGQWALVTTSSATSLSFEVPATDTTGVKDVLIGATTGTVTDSGAFTVRPDDGIATVTPVTVPSYATGTAAEITLDGVGFGATGTVRVGSAAAVAYTATRSGTRIAGVVVATSAAGTLPIVVTPTGSKNPLRASVTVSGPALTYVGPDPEQAVYGPPDPDTYPVSGGQVLDVPTTGGNAMRIEGTGFGTSGTLTLGTAGVATTSWTDTAVTFRAPAHAVGSLSATVTPAHSTLSATRATAVEYVAAAVGLPTVAVIASVVDYDHDNRNDFNPATDVSGAFTLTGTNLGGASGAATRIVVSDDSDTFTVVPLAVTATSLTFTAPRGFSADGWKNVEVDTDVGTGSVDHGVNYLSAGATITATPATGLCLTAATPASGAVTYPPAVVTLANTRSAFGTSGTVTVDGVAVTSTTSYTADQIVFSMARLARGLTPPWGAKTVVITPQDSGLPAQRVGFTCAVTPGVRTTVNGSTSARTMAAGTAYTLGYVTTGFIGTDPFTATAPGGYEYVTAADFAVNGFLSDVHAGAPVGAGDYYVRVAVARATYATERYLAFAAVAVHLTITGRPVTITPASVAGSSVVYRGQLGDGSGTSPSDFRYTATTTADAITSATWEYRDSVCASQGASDGWVDGLPKDVARSSTGCGGDGVTRSSWDVRVKTFAMDATGTDRSILYLASRPTTRITITPRRLSVTGVRADRVYDGTTTATLGPLTVTGAVAGDDIALANASSAGTFANASAGVDKRVTLSADLALAGAGAADYTLSTPRPTVLGTIAKAPAVLSLAASTSSVLLSEHTAVTITATVRDGGTNQVVSGGADAAPVVLTSPTPRICTINATTVTAIAAGTCVIAATEAASTNYRAATAASDPSRATETVSIQVFPAPQTISVIADDLTVAVGDALDPTSQVSGLFDGDSVDGVDYDYFRGTTRLTDAPTRPGTYRVVPTGGTLSAVNSSAYTNPRAFTYVAGTLIITALPPTITVITPAVGVTDTATPVTITGTRLDTVRSLRIGAVTLRAGDFTVTEDGTALTFATPRVAGAGAVDLILVAGTATAAGVFTYVLPAVTAPGAPTHVTALGRDRAIAVTFTPPASNGGAAITGYQASVDGGRTWRPVATVAGAHGTRTAVVAGLTDGVSYSITMRAVNRVGAGSASAAGRARPTAPVVLTVPGAPTRLDAVGHDQRFDVRFTPPASAGGARITAYEISRNNGRTWHLLATRAGAHGTRTGRVTHVGNGVLYRVRVRAVNRYGVGPASRENGALPNAPRLGTVRHAPKSEVAIPKRPRDYHGPRVYTRARDTSHNGSWAHPIPDLGTRQLTVGEAATLSKKSLFEWDSARLTSAGRAAVRNLAGHLRLAHGVNCEGYTDYAGEAGHEKALSTARAKAVCRGLVHYGAHVRFKTHGYGGARPVLIGGAARARDANRRVVVIVTS